MATKKAKTYTPLLEEASLSKSRGLRTSQAGSMAYRAMDMGDDEPERSIFQSFDTHSREQNQHNKAYISDEKSLLMTLFVSVTLLMIGAALITLGIVYIEREDYLLIPLSFGACFILAAINEFVIIYCCSWQIISFWMLYFVLTGLVSLAFTVLGFVSLYFESVSVYDIDYPLWLCIIFAVYSTVALISAAIKKELSVPLTNKSDYLPTHKDTPAYIRKYSLLHPYDRSLLKYVWHGFTHAWIWNIIKLGYQKPLETYDCYNVPLSDNINATLQKWDAKCAELKAQNTINNDSFPTFKILWHLEGRSFTIRTIIYMCGILTSLSVPFIISELSNFYEDQSLDITVGIYLSFALWFAAFIRVALASVAFTNSATMYSRMRSMLIYVIYRKSILSNDNSTTTVGKKITMIAADTKAISAAFSSVHWFIANVALALIICFLLYYEIGPSAFVGWAFFVVLSGPIQGWIGGKIHKTTKGYIQSSDVRVKFIGELIRGIQVTKMYCWESALLEKVDLYRKKEMKQLLIRIVYSSVLSMMNYSIPHLMLLLMLGTYIGLGNELTLSTTFAVIALVQLLRNSILVIPYGIMLIVGAMVSLKRVNHFFVNTQSTDLADIIDALNEKNQSLSDGMRKDSVVFIRNASFKWPKPENTDIKLANGDNKNGDYVELKEEMKDEKVEFELRNISLDLEKGKLYALVGLVGSGKSSLIQAMLKQMIMTDGVCHVNDNGECVGYVAQKSFIINETIRENVLFGLIYNERLYNQCIMASALNEDLKILPNGDMTEIGERGINLSGGQKSRVAFCRALYRKNITNLYLFDDPLSAVDVNVGNIMFTEGILDLLKDKTRVIVMNSHLNLLQYMDEIIILDKGRIAYKGSYKDVMQNETYLHLLPKTYVSDESEEEERTKDKSEKTPKKSSIKNGENDSGETDQEKGALMKAEDRGIGSIKWSVYSRYFSNAATMFNYGDHENNIRNAETATKSKTSVSGILLILLECFLLVLSQTLSSGSDIWLSLWAEDEDIIPARDIEPNTWYLMIWSIIIASLTVISFFGSYLFGYLSLRAAESVHMKTLYHLLRAPMSYFNTTPTGQILNRFSKDTNEMDDELINNFNRFSQCILIVIGYIVVIILANFYALIILVFLIPVLYWIQARYRPASRDLKRMTQITTTPIITQFNETLLGLDTIKSYGLNKYFLNKMNFKTTENHRVFLTEQIAVRWFSNAIDIVIAVFIFIVALLGTLLRDQFSAAMLSLSIVYGYGLMGMLQWSISASVDVEKNFTAIERLLYFEDIESEAPEINFDYRPKKAWPHKGNIQIRSLRMKYRPNLDYVLKGIDVSISEGEKVGIVGRTGAGKTSLLKVLLRMVEPEGDSIVNIDNMDCLNLGLKDLRSNLSIIPQDPVLFSGSIRFNLDPFNEYSDHEIWDILKKCELYTFIHNKQDKLEDIVLEDGSNFSQGQKQLICIGRALLKQSKILFLDEATSSIDKHTDKLIQTLIRKEFVNKTVLCIAHRLETIVDYDKIMVLSDGNVIEYDTPNVLLNKNDDDETSIFKQMMMQKEKTSINHDP